MHAIADQCSEPMNPNTFIQVHPSRSANHTVFCRQNSSALVCPHLFCFIHHNSSPIYTPSTAGGVSFLDVDSIPFSLYGQSDGGVGLFSAVLVDDTAETYTTQVAFVMITPPDVPTLEVTVPIATLPKIVPAAAAAIPIEIDLTHVKIDTMAVAASSLSLGSPSYVGCYLDQVVTAKEAAGAALDGDAWTQSMWTDRALPYVQLTKVNSIQACAAIASAHDSLFFGMEAGSECW